MRRLLLSTAALILLAAPALAQPDHDRGDRGERGHDTAQNRGQDAPRQAAPQQQSTPFNRSHNPGSEQHVSPVVQPQAAAPVAAPQPQAADRGNWRGRGAGQAAAPVAQPATTPQDRGNRDRNNWQTGQNNGRDFNRNRGNDNFGNRDNRPNNRQGNNYGNSYSNNDGNNRGYNGQRHDYSSFRDFHRSFNASRRFRAPDYRRPNGWYDHRWSFGEFLPSLFWGNSYWLTDYYRYDLPPPPYGTVWVRERHDALLIDRDTGEIISVAYDVFY